MKKSLLFFSILLISICAKGQNNDSIFSKVKFKGFVKADAIIDSRQNVTARENFVLMYPKKPLLDKNGVDIYNRFQYNQFATSSRLIVSVDTIRFHKSLISAYLETDFTGASESTNSGLRLRHGYLKVDNHNSQWIIGQYWHPLAAPEVFPDMLSLNLGNPIKSAMRAPQIRYQQILNSFRFVGVASVQRDNSSIGSNNIVVPDYLRNQVIPSLHIQSIYTKNNFLFGVGFDFKRLKMRIATDSNLRSNELVNSSTIHAFSKLDFKKLTIKAQWILGQNLYDQAMLGGVGVTKIDSLTNEFRYTPFSQSSFWVNVATKFPKFNMSLFSGVAINLGTQKPLVDVNNAKYTNARGSDILYIYRVAPQFSYKMGRIILFSETELTAAAYGIPNQYGIVQSAKESINIRENLAVLFQF